MKKIVFILLIISVMVLGGCYSKGNAGKISDIKGVTWKVSSGSFDLDFTYDEMQDQKNYNFNSNDYFSTITIDGEDYPCTVTIGGTSFLVMLVSDPDTYFRAVQSKNGIGGIAHPYGSDINFLYGKCSYSDVERVYNEDYKYILRVDLTSNCQYAEYCSENGIEYPDQLLIYGYVN